MVNGDIGKQLGNYKLLKLLGRGGFADVYLGEQIYLKTPAAIKVLHTHLSDEALQQFIGEARTIAGLVHPHIIGVLDFGIDDHIPFLVMHYARHGSLRRLHPRKQILPLSLVVAYVGQIAQALQYAHEHKVIHRDVKPENMLLGDDNLLKLSDFGIAMASHSTYTRPTRRPEEEPIGTTTYMAPEQFTNEATIYSDQYALGIVIYEWLTGEPPFVGTDVEVSFHHVHAAVPSLQSKAPHLPAALDMVVQRALAKDPRARFPRVIDFAQALASASATSALYSAHTVRVVPPSVVPPSIEEKRPSQVDVHATPALSESNSTLQGPVQAEPGHQLHALPATPMLRPVPVTAAMQQQSRGLLNSRPLTAQVYTPPPIHRERPISRRVMLAGAAGLAIAGTLGIVAAVAWQHSSQQPEMVVPVPQVPTSAPTAAVPTEPPPTPTPAPPPPTIISTTRPTAVSWGVGQFDLFVRGTDNALWQRHYDGTLHNWVSVTSPLTYDPTVVSWGPNRFDLVVRGPDNALQHSFFDGAWHPVEILGGALTADAAAASWAPGRLDVFIKNSDNALWHQYFDGTWHPWESLGGLLTSSPTAVATGVNLLDVFVRGVDNGLWVKHFDGAWHDWQPLGGSLTSDPVVVSWVAGRLDVFARGAENTLQHIWYEGTWHAWESLGGSLASAPAAASWGPNRIDVFARGFDNSLQHTWLDGSWHPWQPLN